MKIAILGGSFNPVHIGHLFLVDTVLSAFNYDKVILIPAHQSPFKPEPVGASVQDRLDMLAAAVSGDPRIGIDNCEIKRKGISYTIDTISEIKKRYCCEGRIGLIIGDDLSVDFYKWKESDKIAEEADIILAQRLFGAKKESSFDYPHKKLNNELINVSSEIIREKIAKRENWRSLLPQGVRCIIEDRGLYGYKTNTVYHENDNYHQLIITIENDVRMVQNNLKFIHTRNTALLAGDLCKSYNLSPMSGYLAGIAHDMCKFMEANELMQLARRDGKGITALEMKKPGLLHGRAAAVLLEKKYGVKDKEILNAVSSHVTCGKDMGDLAKILYIADKIEFSRDYIHPEIRKMCGLTSLDELFNSVLEENITFLKTQKKEISYNARKLLAVIEKRKTYDKDKG